MAANQTDKFKKTGASTVTPLSAPGKALAATSITVGSTTNFPLDTGFIVAIRQVNTAGTLVAGTYTEWSAIVTSGTTLAITAVPVYGTDQVYPAGSTTQVYIPLSFTEHNSMVDGILVQHNQDGTHGVVTAASVTASAGVQGATVTSTGDLQVRSTSVETIQAEDAFDFIASGGVWSGDGYGASLNASMTAVVAYINGRRGTISAVTAHAFTASKDTYIDILNTAGTFSLVYTEVANNAASPALAANSLRLAIVVTGANIANVGSVNQGQENKVLPIASSIAYTTTDSLGNLICPRDPSRKLLGYRQIITNFATSSGLAVQVTGLSAPVIVPTGRRVIITVYSSNTTNAAGGIDVILGVWDGVVGSGTLLNSTGIRVVTATTGYGMQTTGISTPATTSKTYNAALTSGGASSSTINASTTTAAWIKVELA